MYSIDVLYTKTDAIHVVPYFILYSANNTIIINGLSLNLMVARSAGYDSFRVDHFSMISTKRTIADLILISAAGFTTGGQTA